MNTTHRDRILAHLTQPIASPYVPPPVPKLNRWGLAPNQLLTHRLSAEVWVVASCDSQGVTLATMPNGGPFGPTFRLTDANWKVEWAKVPKPRVSRVRKLKP